MTAGKRYSVFVSSTWEDLKEERAAVYQAVLENCGIPIGMEQFPAGAPKVSLFKSLIDECDYLVVVSAANYGSIDPDSQQSYTEIEVRYAASKGIPVIPFVMKMGELPYKQVSEIEHRRKLQDFHEYLTSKLGVTCKFYGSPSELRAMVGSTLNSTYISQPRPGLTRGNDEPRRGPLEGVWELRPIPRGKKGVHRFKIYTSSTYVVLDYNDSSGAIGLIHGGAYSLLGDMYLETCFFAANTRRKVGDTHSFTANVSGDSLQIARPRLDETWIRSELTPVGSDESSGS